MSAPPLDLAELDAAWRERFATSVAARVFRSPWRAPSRWRDCVVIFPGDKTQRIDSRDGYARHLRDHGLDVQAHECLHRAVRPGEVLCWLEGEDANFALAGFLVFDLRAALRGST